MTAQYETFRIIDATAHKAWSKLVGVDIPRDTVRVPRDFYLKHAAEIHAIQFASAWRKP